jgi:hypothetical protein
MKQTWFGLLVVGGIVAVMAPMIVLAAGGTGEGFEAVVHGIEDRYHTHATQIPFMGLISGIARVSTHGGVKGMHVAEFEHFDATVDGDEFNALVEKRAGKGWERMVRDTSKGGANQTLILVRPEGEHMGMLVVDLSGHEMDVVQMSLNPQELTKQLRDHHVGSHSHDSNDDRNYDSKESDSKGQGTESE